MGNGHLGLIRGPLHEFRTKNAPCRRPASRFSVPASRPHPCSSRLHVVPCLLSAGAPRPAAYRVTRDQGAPSWRRGRSRRLASGPRPAGRAIHGGSGIHAHCSGDHPPPSVALSPPPPHPHPSSRGRRPHTSTLSAALAAHDEHCRVACICGRPRGRGVDRIDRSNFPYGGLESRAAGIPFPYRIQPPSE
jgi:hypothetical protein